MELDTLIFNPNDVASLLLKKAKLRNPLFLLFLL